jgi:hypothetical protein
MLCFFTLVPFVGLDVTVSPHGAHRFSADGTPTRVRRGETRPVGGARLRVVRNVFVSTESLRSESRRRGVAVM